MQNGHGHSSSPLDRLVRDMNSLGRDHLPAAERLTAELGDDLLAAIHAELARLDARAFPLCRRPRRVA
jgi:hypothetical protein